MTSTPLRAGLIGFGLAGRIFHAPFLTAAGFTLDAIVTTAAERVAQAQAEYPDVAVLSDPAQLWDRDLDLVVVATPNSSHVPLALAALRSGHHVVIDKPFAPSVTQARSVVQAAEQADRRLSVFQSRRFDSDFRTLRSVLDAGTLGQVWRFESRYERWRPELRGNWRESADPDQAGGLLFDLGAHLIDQFLQLFGTPETVYAEVLCRRPGAQVDDDTMLSLQAGDVRGQLWVSSVAADLGPRFRVLGSRAGFVVHGVDPQEAALLAGARPPAPGWGLDPAARPARVGAGEDWQPVATEPGDYTDYYRQMAAAIAGRGAVPVDPRDSIVGLQVIEAARRSAATGQVIRLDAADVLSDGAQANTASHTAM